MDGLEWIIIILNSFNSFNRLTWSPITFGAEAAAIQPGHVTRKIPGPAMPRGWLGCGGSRQPVKFFAASPCQSVDHHTAPSIATCPTWAAYVSRFVSWTCSRLDKSCRCMFLLFFSSYSSSVLLSGFVTSAGCGSFLHRCFRCWLRALLFLLLRFSLLTFVWLVLVLRLLRILSTLRCYS